MIVVGRGRRFLQSIEAVVLDHYEQIWRKDTESLVEQGAFQPNTIPRTRQQHIRNHVWETIGNSWSLSDGYSARFVTIDGD